MSAKAALRVVARGEIFYAYDEGDQLIGYADVGHGSGYGGPVEMLVGINTSGVITGVRVVEHRETPGFFRRLPEEDFLSKFPDGDAGMRLRLGQDLDAASGATVSSEVVAAVRRGVRAMAGDEQGMEVPSEKEAIQMGVPEVVLAALYVAGYFGHRSRNLDAKKWIRRGTLLTGAVV